MLPFLLEMATLPRIPSRISGARSGILILASALAAAATPIEPQHPVYEFLRRLDLKGLVVPDPKQGTAGGFSGIRPWDSGEIAARLEAVESRQDRLAPWERRRLEDYLDEFSPAHRREATRLRVVDSAYSVFAGVDFWGAGYVQDSIPEAQRFLFGSLNPWIDAAFWNGAYAFSQGSVGMERSHVARFTETYNPVDGLPYNTSREGKQGIPQNVSTFDGFRVLAGYRRRPLRIDAGQDWNRLGFGQWQNATFGTTGYFWVQDSLPPSDTVGFPGTRYPGRYRRGYRVPGESAPMPQVRLLFEGDRFAYLKFIGVRDGIVADQLATVVVQRLEWRALPVLSLGATELVSIGGRVPDPTYWIPLVPLKFQEHQSRDKDNYALSVDAEGILRGWGRVYGELYLDDFSGPPLDFWGNKFAYALGFEWIDPFRPASALRAEFAHVDPWVFTHHLPGRQHQSSGALYGSQLPGNAHALWIQAETALGKDLQAGAQYIFQQRDLRSRGSSLFDVHLEGVDDREKPFLGDTPETRHRLDMDLTWAWRRHVRFRAGAGLMTVDDWKGTAGEDLFTTAFLGELLLRY